MPHPSVFCPGHWACLTLALPLTWMRPWTPYFSASFLTCPVATHLLLPSRVPMGLLGCSQNLLLWLKSSAHLPARSVSLSSS